MHSKMSTQQEQDKPYYYILRCTGKQIRTKLIQAFNHWIKIPDDKLELISEIVEMLHNSSLLIDDIEDNSILRRGVPVAHNIFGVASTINAANYVYFLSLEKIIKHLPKECSTNAVIIYTDQLLELHRGQGMDIYWRDTHICPSEDEYLEMVRKKTGGLFGLGVKLMQLLGDDHRDFTNLIAILGSYFQIRDDYANLKSEEYTENKSYCEDLTEGKFSFPVINAIKSHPEDPTLINILRQKPTNVEIKKFAVELMEKLGSFEYTLQMLNKLDLSARSECELLGGNPHLIQLLNMLNIIK